MKKRVLSLTLAILILSALILSLPLSASAEESGKCGTNLTWTLDDEGTLTISGTGAMYYYSYGNYAPWYGFKQNIKKVIINSGVVTVGAQAFYGCENLAEIELPDGIKSIGSYAFNNCGLISIYIPESITTIESQAFNACDELTAVHISDLTSWCSISFKDLNSNPLRFAGKLYLNNQLITELTIPSDITDINDFAFCGSSTITEINLHNNINSIGKNTFYGCYGLTSIEIPNSIKRICYDAFDYCNNLTKVYISDLEAWCNISFLSEYSFEYNPFNSWDLYIDGQLATEIVIPNSVKNINCAFSKCKSITNIVLPDNATEIGENAFKSCINLSDIEIPESVISIGESAFESCASLKSIKLGNDISSIAYSTFSGCISLSEIDIPSSVTSIGSYAFYGCSDLKNINIPHGVEEIGNYAFTDCINLQAVNVPTENSNFSSQDGVLFNKDKTELIYYPLGKNGGYIIPDGVTAICDYAFSYSKLSDIVLPNSLRDIGEWAFGYCTNLKNIDIPASVKNIGYASFNHCTGLQNIELHDGLISIGSWAFEYCTALESVEIPDSVTDMDWPVFSHCESLTKAVLGKGITSINARTFEYCSSLESIDIMGDVTSIGSGAFQYCAGLKSFEIPYGVTKIAESTFQGCTSLATIEISDNITKIDSYAFYDCDSLININIPASVETIGSSAFESCGALININVDAGNDNYCSHDGALFNKDRTTLITCPEGKTGEFTIPASVTSIKDDFGYKLTDINVEDNNTAYSSENGVLYNADKTKLIRYPGGKSGELVISESITIIESGALSSDKLTDITFINPDNITGGIDGRTFLDCSALTDINIISSEKYSSDDGVLFSNDKSEIIRYPVGKNGGYSVPDGVKIIGVSAFYGCINLTEIDIPETVTQINHSAFAYCVELKSVNMPDSISEIGGYAFCGCKNLADIKISKGLTFIDMDVFQGIGAEAVEIPEGVTAIELGAFSYCSNLKSIILPVSLMYIGQWAFQDDSELTDIYYRGSKEQWSDIEIYSDNEWFVHSTVHYNYIGDNTVNSGTCGDNLTWTLDHEVLSISGTGKMYDYNCRDWETDAPWFEYNSQIKSVTVADGVTGIGKNAFLMCRNLSQISLPDGIEYIGESAFEHTEFSYDMKNWEDGSLYIGNYLIEYRGEMPSCIIKDGTECLAELSLYKQSYDYIVVPASVKYIGNSAFYGCEISTVYYAGTEEQWGCISIGSENEALENAKIEYKTITNDGNLKVKDLDITANEIDFKVEPKLSVSDSVVYVGVYDDSGKLINVKSYTMSENIDVKLENKGNALKVMWWGDENCQPLADRIKINLNN